MEEKTITLSRMIAGSPGEVYLALTNSTQLRLWLCDLALVTAKPAGKVYLVWESGYFAAGKIVELIKDKKVSYEWRGSNDPASSLVTFTLEPKKDHTFLTVEHSRLGQSIEWATTLNKNKKGWTISLENLASMFETGIDLRISQRPFIGIYPEEYHKTNENDLIPIKRGVRLVDVVSGHSAEKAGLKSGDVITFIDDFEVVDFTSMTRAIGHYKAGDSVTLTYYRKADKITQEVLLSHLAMPRVPGDFVLLAEQIRQEQAKAYQELSEIIAKVKENEGDYRPAPKDWTIKEVIAHLIHSERDHQAWISNFVLNQEPVNDEFFGNLDAKVKATVAVYPTLPELMKALASSLEETVLCIEYLPEEFIKSKSLMWRLTFMGTQLTLHTRSHFDQILENLKQARQK